MLDIIKRVLLMLAVITPCGLVRVWAQRQGDDVVWSLIAALPVAIAWKLWRRVMW
jgi:hypothetical protein